MDSFIKEEAYEGITVLTLSRVEKRNALNYRMANEIIDTLEKLTKSDDCKAVVITGSGSKAFCSGMDLNNLAKFDEIEATNWVTNLQKLYTTIRMFDKPLIAAINGIAAGAGYQIALLADIRIGCPNTKMSQPEINVGLPSLLGAHLMLPFLGLSKTTELTYTGRTMDSDEVLQLGLISKIVSSEKLLEESIDYAEDLASKSPLAFRKTKEQLRKITQPGLDKLFTEAKRIQSEAFSTGEPQKIILEKIKEFKNPMKQ
tara:strand:+ start:29554 stop:30327 length:774 start_codon:yes stop_codon:yes gene_type:complete